MFRKACRRDDLAEGRLDVAAIDRTLVLLLWPEGGTPRAFQGFCPHAREPLADARFDGDKLTCHITTGCSTPVTASASTASAAGWRNTA